MYKVLNSKGLGVAGRQNELIELALTHGFQGVEIDMTDLVGRHDALGKEFACQFLQSAKMDIGTFDLPINFGGTDAEFVASCEQLETIMDLAATLNAKRCRVKIEPNNETASFQENFERHQERIEDIAGRFEEHGIRVGLYLQASTAVEADGNYKFIQTAEEILTLIKAIGHANVGLSLDTWEWVIGGGAMDQISELDLAVLSEVILSDIGADANPGSYTAADRVLPCTGGDTFSLKLCQFLKEKGYDGAMSMGTEGHMYAGAPNRHVVAGKLSTMLDKLAEGEDPTFVEEPEVEEGEEGEGGDTDGEKKEENVAADAEKAAAGAETAAKETPAEAPAKA
jgi:sugar phosphate isomerase/epimerase